MGKSSINKSMIYVRNYGLYVFQINLHNDNNLLVISTVPHRSFIGLPLQNLFHKMSNLFALLLKRRYARVQFTVRLWQCFLRIHNQGHHFRICCTNLKHFLSFLSNIDISPGLNLSQNLHSYGSLRRSYSSQHEFSNPRSHRDHSIRRCKSDAGKSATILKPSIQR